MILMQSVASDVCKDLILYDNPKENQFRKLIPIALDHPVLLQIIIATSAIRMSHTRHKLGHSHAMTASTEAVYQSTTATAIQRQDFAAYSRVRNHALIAKYKALSLLQYALSNATPMDLDVILAVILLFVEFELLDSGRDDWIHHIDGARKIIEKLCGSNLITAKTMSPLRRCLVSNCLVYVNSHQFHDIPLTL